MPDPAANDAVANDPVASNSLHSRVGGGGGRMLRLVLMGTGPFAVPTFNALVDTGHECVIVFTRPEKTGGGKKKPEKSPVRQWAESRDLDVVAPESVNNDEAKRIVEESRPDLLVVCDYGQILKNDVLRLARLGGINLHGSLLPAHRGAAPVQWAVLKGDTESGVSVIHMTPRLDAGPVIAIRKTVIEPTETAGQLEQRLALIGVQATIEAVELLTESANLGPDGELDLHGIPQDDTLASRAPRLSKADGRIDWSRTADQLDWHVRGMQPWPGAFCEVPVEGKSEPLRLAVQVVRVPAMVDFEDGEPLGNVLPQPGVARIFEQRLLVGCGDGWIELTAVKPAGKREMPASDWLRGRPIVDGVIFQ